MLNILALRLLAEDDVGKIIGGAVVFLIWIIGAIASAVKKHQEKQRQMQRQGHVPPVERAERRPPERQVILQERPFESMRRPTNRPKPSRHQRKAVRPVPLPPEPEPPQVLRPAPPLPPVQVAPRRAAAVGVSAAAIHQWLRPSTLRSQYILTEVLRPPLSLRESD